MSKNATADSEILESINRNLEMLSKKIERVIELQEGLVEHFTGEKKKADFDGLPLDINTLMSLPDHLRKTAIAICSLGRATASQVAAETGRTRAAESDYLNQLAGMGHLKKGRKGREVYFYIKKKVVRDE